MLFCSVFVGCNNPKNNRNFKYTVISSFNETMLETNDKAKAYETAHNLTLMGRVFQSKPCYFVVENK